MKTVLRILFLTIIGCLILGQLGRFEIGTSAVYYHDILIAAWNILCLFLFRKEFLSLCKRSRSIWFIGLFSLWIVVTTVAHFAMSPSQLASSFLYLVRFDSIVLFGITVFLAMRNAVFSASEVRQALFSFPIGIALFGLAQYILFPDTRGLVYLGWDDHYYRLISTIFDPGFTGVILAMGCLVVLPVLHSRYKQRASYLIPFLSFSLCFLGLLLTYSRASYVALIAGIIVMVWRTKKLQFLVVIVLLALGIVLLPRPGGEGVKLERTASITARIESVEGATNTLTPTAIAVGNGWYANKTQKSTNVSHGVVVPNHSVAPENSYVFVLTSLGLVGFLLWGAFIGSLIVGSKVNAIFTSVVAAVGAHALFSNTLFHPFVLIFLALVAAGVLSQRYGWK